MGFDGGRVLEPGCGTGLFFALCPEALVGKLALTGVEMDPTTARIAKLLYPNARIRDEDFTQDETAGAVRPRDRQSSVCCGQIYVAAEGDEPRISVISLAQATT